MQIVCPHCATAYAISAEALGAGGRTVRCARCQTVWHAGSDGAEDAVAPEEMDRDPTGRQPLQGSTIEEAEAAGWRRALR